MILAGAEVEKSTKSAIWKAIGLESLNSAISEYMTPSIDSSELIVGPRDEKGELILIRSLRMSKSSSDEAEHSLILPDRDKWLVLFGLVDDNRLARRALLLKLASELNIITEEAWGLILNAAKEKLRETEKGTIFHYHQIPLARLAEAINDRRLLPAERQEELGKPHRATGSRGDVVQMTRDSFNSEGTRVKQGLGAALTEDRESVTLILPPSIIEDPFYDCTGEYPNLLEISLDNSHITAILTPNGEDSVITVSELLRSSDWSPQVMSREAWRQKNYN